MGEPSENPAAPQRRRRRRLIVASALVLVSTIAWWHWPRGDARFVGKWKMRLPSPIFIASFVPKGKPSEYQFFANGFGRRLIQPPPLMLTRTGPVSQNFRWWVQNDVLVVEPAQLSGLKYVYAQAQTNIAPIFRLQPALHRERWRVHFLGDEALEITDTKLPRLHPISLKRIRDELAAAQEVRPLHK